MAQLAQIHIAKKELGLDDETYRAMLWTCARVHSSADLDHAGRAKVLDHLKGLGWKSGRQKRNKKPTNDPRYGVIRELWLELHANGVVNDPSEQATIRFIKNQTKIDSFEWLSTKQVSSLIERLKQWLKRTQNKVAIES